LVTAIIVFALAVFFCIALLFVALNEYSKQKQMATDRMQLQNYLGGFPATTASATRAANPNILRNRIPSGIGILNQILSISNLSEGMAVDLARADVGLKVGEYVLLRLAVATALAMVFSLFGLPFVVLIVIGVAGFYAPKFYLKYLESKRVKAFNDQLVDALYMLSSSLKAGFNVTQGCSLVAREMPTPMADEMDQTLTEMALGYSFYDAISNLGKRINSYDLDLAVTALLIHGEVGGNLSEILDNISNTIRQRIQMKNEVHSLTGEVRISAILLGALPIIMAIVLFMLSPQYMMELFHHPLGPFILLYALVSEIIGILILRQMADISI
jgi:tight adherence protein B